MSYFKFRQNNSFGHFVGTPLVFVQADNAADANRIAQDHGVYFNGVADGIDCDCCGDRWYPVHDDDAQDQPRRMVTVVVLLSTATATNILTTVAIPTRSK